MLQFTGCGSLCSSLTVLYGYSGFFFSHYICNFVYLLQISKALAGPERKDLMKKLPKFIYDEDKALEVESFSLLHLYIINSQDKSVFFFFFLRRLLHLFLMFRHVILFYPFFFSLRYFEFPFRMNTFSVFRRCWNVLILCSIFIYCHKSHYSFYL